VSIEIIEESSADLSGYERVPIAFEVRSRYEVNAMSGGGGFQLVEKPAGPFIKDYDAHERPATLTKRFDLSNWGFFAAFNAGMRVGGAIVAWNTHGVEMLEGRDDIVCLWDIRVLPDQRGYGIGRQLFAFVETWAKHRRCTLLKVETQDINVPACKFYENLGCELLAVDENAYPDELNEIQLLWYKRLSI
jgi:GNAT superfamily N-acetyltransferase